MKEIKTKQEIKDMKTSQREKEKEHQRTSGYFHRQTPSINYHYDQVVFGQIFSKFFSKVVIFSLLLIGKD